MTAPMAAVALVSWLKNPYEKSKTEVKVNRLARKEICFMILLTIAVTWGFYHFLAGLNTANLIPSTVSIATSFLAAYLTFRCSPFFAIAYAANDVVLIVLWVLAALSDISYLSVTVCFVMFLANDIYGFINWFKMRRRQEMLDCG